MTYWEDHTVLVTGASRGIGREIAIHLSKLGCRVAVNYNSSQSHAEEVLSQCNPEKTKIYKADVGQEDQVKAMIDAIEKDLGQVTLLINNAGQTRDTLLMTMSTDDWKSVMATHLDGAFFCTRGVVRGMVRKKFGRVVNITSVSGIKGTPGQCNYSAAKAGLIGFTKALAREMGKKNITSNAIALGVIDTDMTRVLSEEVLNQYKDATAVKRLGTTNEVAKLVEYLCGPDSGYITAQVITLDGGII